MTKCSQFFNADKIVRYWSRYLNATSQIIWIFTCVGSLFSIPSDISYLRFFFCTWWVMFFCKIHILWELFVSTHLWWIRRSYVPNCQVKNQVDSMVLSADRPVRRPQISDLGLSCDTCITACGAATGVLWPPGPGGEIKEGGEPGKTVSMPGGRIGYSGGGQGFPVQHHSLFKCSTPTFGMM